MSANEIINTIPNTTKQEILEYLLSRNGAYYGDLVMVLKEDTLTILEHLIELKNTGFVYKDQRGGKFRINDDLKDKIKHSGEAIKTHKESKRHVVEEMNQFSKTTRKRVNRVENDISINKQIPGEQNVKPGK